MVATRSRITGDDRAPSDHVSDPPLPPPHFYHNPHQGLKEKMKALTAMYEQHKIKTHRTSITDLPVPDSTRKKRSRGLEDEESAMRENIKPDFEAKENRIAVLSCPKKVMVPRKLSLGAPSVSRKVGGELGVIPEKGEAGSRIMVFVRLRPMSKKEKEAGSRSCVKIMNKKDVYLTEFASETDYLRLKRLRGRHFCFDTAFPDTTSQQEVYSTTTSELVEGVLQGRNGSVFCYGATGAGKTYTMLGMVENPGVMVLAIKDLFAKIRQRSYDGNHLVHLSYLEVYNETVRDLLSPGRPLILREDKQGIIAAGLTQYRAYSTDEVMALLHQGNQNRTTEPTRANETSSRSHAILQVVAEFRTKDSVNVVNRVGKLSLIDLAGSERALATDQRTLRSLEGANINRSLLALSSCINALVEGKKHIPYRNSKLTQLLKDSLGGPCNTVMIANISPSNLSFGETQNTLHWADRAKEIKTKACIIGEEAVQVPESATDQAKLVLQLQKENSELRQQLVLHQHKLFTIQAQSLASNASPMPLSPLPSTTPCSTQKKTKRPLISGNCFGTPESRRRGTTDDTTVKDLQRTIKALEATIQRLNKEHTLQIKQKDDFIRELIIKKGSEHIENGDRRAVTRASLCKGVRGMAADGELKSPSHRFTSPSPAAKKQRSFWETGVNSPSVSARKTRSQVKEEIPPAPSMLLQLAYHTFWFVFMLGPHVAYHILQPGFARQRR